MSHSPERGPAPTPGPTSGFTTKARLGIRRGIHRGLQGFLWIIKIVVPVSLAVALLDWTGWLYALDPLFSPVMALMNLPPQAALPILSAVFSSFYAAVAMMVVIPFTHPQLILMAIFMSIAHMLVVEGIIQHKSGMNVAAIALIRLIGAGVATYLVSQLFVGTAAPVVMPQGPEEQIPLAIALWEWTLSTLNLMLRIFFIIFSVMIVLETLKELHLTGRIAALFRPLMVLLGLPPNVATMWVTGVFFGIVYGSAVIVEEAGSGRFSGDELKRLHISLGLCHSMVEDPALFLALGVGFQWTVLPRLATAAVAVQLYGLVNVLRLRLRPEPHQQPF